MQRLHKNATNLNDAGFLKKTAKNAKKNEKLKNF